MQARRRMPTINDLRVKLCYICREEERYDAPEDPPRVWTHPCNCTLVAHETCLLHWIQTSQTNRARANALKCPQCGVPYQLTSSNPWILRLLNMGNKGLSVVGRVVTVGSLTVVVVSLGTGLYLLCTAYGAYALQEFLGAEMFDLLLTEDPSNWPWHSFINLPLIPLSLILSRLPFKRMFTPLIPLLLAWPTSTPVMGNRIMISEHGPTAGGLDEPLPLLPIPQAKEMFPLLPSWPPPPIVLGLFVLPIVRDAYKRLFSQFSKWVLDSTPGVGVWGGEVGQGARGARDLQRVLMRDAVDEEPFLRIRVNARVDEEEDGPAPPGALPEGQANRGQRQVNNNDGDRQNNNEGNNNNNNNNHNNDGGDDGARDAAAVAEDTIHISGTSLGRLIGGALVIPRISSLMGSLLLWLSKYSTLLHRFLAVRPPVRWTTTPSGRMGLGMGMGILVGPSLMGNKSWDKMSLLRKLGVAGMLGFSVAWRGTFVWAECDPVWWRNSLGLGLFTVAKDCIQLLHLYLTKRELETRRVNNRSFEGVDIRELDLIDPPAHA